MRYGAVTPEQVARMARRADKSGQLGVATFLFALAVDLEENPKTAYRYPLPVLLQDTIEKGNALADRAEQTDGRKTTS